MDKERIDKLLVERGLAESRHKAQALILAGHVQVDDKIIDKPGTLVLTHAQIKIKELPPYVSRGGLKLERALQAFGISVTSKIGLDLGASTGGFTDCLLQFGAARVYALDVGRGQLDWKLRSDPRVVCIEGINVRYLKPDLIPDPVDVVTVDLSFISLTLVLPALKVFLQKKARGSAEVIALIKPQFEVGKGEVGRGGIVKDKEKHEKVIEKISRFAEHVGFQVKGLIESPIRGAEGNKEFLIYLVDLPSPGGA